MTTRPRKVKVRSKVNGREFLIAESRADSEDLERLDKPANQPALEPDPEPRPESGRKPGKNGRPADNEKETS